MAGKTGGTRVTIKTGTCGPRHDPYGWKTITVCRNGHEFELHDNSLSDPEFAIDGQTQETDDAVAAFEAAAGASADHFERWYNERIYQEDPMGCLADYE